MAVARRQRGVISWPQLHACGVSSTGVASLCDSRRLIRLARSIYCLPGEPGCWERDLWIAFLRAGRGAVVSHRSAAALYELDAFKPGPVELSVPAARRPRLAGVRHDHIYRVDQRWFDDVRAIRGLRVTSVADTLLDLGFLPSFVSADRLERAVECALRLGLTSEADLRAVLGRRGRSRRNALGTVLGRRRPGAAPTESDAETLFLQLTRRAGLPDPERQFRLQLRSTRYRLDFAWPERRLAVEVDGAETHANAEALIHDLRRQNRIVMGWLLQRYTWNDIVRCEAQVIDLLRDAWALLLAGPMPPSTWAAGG